MPVGLPSRYYWKFPSFPQSSVSDELLLNISNIQGDSILFHSAATSKNSTSFLLKIYSKHILTPTLFHRPINKVSSSLVFRVPSYFVLSFSAVRVWLYRGTTAEIARVFIPKKIKRAENWSALKATWYFRLYWWKLHVERGAQKFTTVHYTFTVTEGSILWTQLSKINMQNTINIRRFGKQKLLKTSFIHKNNRKLERKY